MLCKHIMVASQLTTVPFHRIFWMKVLIWMFCFHLIIVFLVYMSTVKTKKNAAWNQFISQTDFMNQYRIQHLNSKLNWSVGLYFILKQRHTFTFPLWPLRFCDWTYNPSSVNSDIELAQAESHASYWPDQLNLNWRVCSPWEFRRKKFHDNTRKHVFMFIIVTKSNRIDLFRCTSTGSIISLYYIKEYIILK